MKEGHGLGVVCHGKYVVLTNPTHLTVCFQTLSFTHRSRMDSHLNKLILISLFHFDIGDWTISKLSKSFAVSVDLLNP